MAELADFTGNMVQPGAAPLSTTEPLSPLADWQKGLVASPQALFSSHVYTQGDQPNPRGELPSFLGTTGMLNERAALTGYVAHQFFTGKLDASQVQHTLQQAIEEKPDVYPLQTIADGLRAIGYQPGYTKDGKLSTQPTRIPEAFPLPGESMLSPSG